MDTLLFTYRKTYNAGLLQAKAFRILKKHTNIALAPFGISATEWGILGLLCSHSQGLSLTDIAHLLGVKPPFVTRSMAVLLEKKLVVTTVYKTDSRVKINTLTNKGALFIKQIEPAVAIEIKKTFTGVSVRNLFGYLSTLHTIVQAYPLDSHTTDLSHLVE